MAEGPLRPWLFRIARNVSHDHGRRRLRRPEALCEVDAFAAPQTRDEEHALVQAELAYARLAGRSLRTIAHRPRPAVAVPVGSLSTGRSSPGAEEVILQRDRIGDVEQRF